MNLTCSQFFEKTLEDARISIEPLATKYLDNLAGFVYGLYLTKQIENDEELELHQRIMEVRLNRDIMGV